MLPRVLASLPLLGILAGVHCGPPVPPLPASRASTDHARPDAGQSQSPHHDAHHAHSGHAGGEHPHGGHSCGTLNHRFDDAERWAKVFDDPKRDAWQKPDEIVKELGLGPDDRVADLGAGTGYFSSRLARAVPKGKVFAIDIEPNLVEHMKKRAEREGTPNVEAVLGTASDPKLPAGVKLVLVVDTYHHIGERTDYFRRVRERLSSGGRVVIVDFKKGDLPVGPPDAHKLAPDVVEKEMTGAGYSKCKAFDGLPYQYMLTFAEKC